MKKLILLSGLLIAGLSINAQSASKQNASAQQNQNEDPAVRATRQTEKMTQVLGLTADQKAKVYAIYLDKDKAISAAKVKDTDAKVFADERKVIRSQRDAAIKAVLTPEQQAKWENEKQKNKGRAGAGDDK
ncbi:MAG: hypothetical protein JWP12_3936 [Bacteroidetes bacterium]|nr:hypothetical protein [Bacteroidota bacterium]